jgi:hypothetical protein
MLKKATNFILGRREPLNVRFTRCNPKGNGSPVCLGVLAPCGSPAERRVLARRGLAGENGGLFEHPGRKGILVQVRRR